jgi:hypothetical protein
MQKPNNALQPQIFDESATLHRNTVNGCFPGRSNGPVAISAMLSLGTSTNGESAPVVERRPCPAFRLA